MNNITEQKKNKTNDWKSNSVEKSAEKFSSQPKAIGIGHCRSSPTI